MKSIKFINVQQAKQIHHFKNIDEKLYKTNTSIWHNKSFMFQCICYLIIKNRLIMHGMENVKYVNCPVVHECKCIATQRLLL
jgi:hypothetical protein